MSETLHHRLGRRERQIVDALFRLEEATVAEVVDELGDESIHDSVRVTLRNLEKKGVVTHREEEQRYVYRPAIRREQARRSAMTHLVRTFFDDSPTSAMLAFLDMSESAIGEEELSETQERIEEAARRAGADEADDGPSGEG